MMVGHGWALCLFVSTCLDVQYVHVPVPFARACGCTCTVFHFNSAFALQSNVI